MAPVARGGPERGRISDRYDTVVIGGGPAGSAAAIGCAERGLRVALLERAAFPRTRPGETLHPGVEPLLARLGVTERVLAAGFLRHEGHWVEWDGDRRFIPFGRDRCGPWLGFQAWRSDFDAILLERTRALGVEVRQPCVAMRPVLEQGRVTGVLTPIGPLTAAYVIDASGSHHWLARHLGLPIERHSPQLIARFGYVTGACPARDAAPVLIVDTTGWTWTAMVRPGVYHWTRLRARGDMGGGDPVPGELRGLRKLGRAYSADVTWTIVTQPAGPGYFIVGDAAAVVDPASSHGVIKAVMSGMLAGYAVTQLAAGLPAARGAVNAYCRWVREWFVRDISNLRALYRRLRIAACGAPLVIR